MKLLEIYAEDFGCLHDRRFTLGEGFNLIEGPNESGKSTLLALLQFIFYGFPRRNGPEGEERDKRLSWQWRRAAGSLTLLFEEHTYTVTRKYTLRGTTAREIPYEELSVIDAVTGKEMRLEGKTPGEYFLGLPAELYDSSLCVRQSDVDRVGTPTTGEAVGNLLFSGGSGFDTEDAERILQNARRELQHYKGRGGRVAELEDRLATLDEKLTEAREDVTRLQQLRTDVSRHTAQVAERRRQLNAINASLSVADLDSKLARYDEWHRAKEEEEACRMRLEALRSSREYEIMPDHGFFDRVRTLLRNHTRAEDSVLHTKPEVERLRAVHFDEALIEGHARAEEMGGIVGIEKKINAAGQQRNTCFIAAVTALLIALVLMIGAFAFSDAFLPLLLIGAVAGVAALVLLYRGIQYGFTTKITLRRLGVEDAALLRTYLEQCRIEDEAYLIHREKLFLVEAQLTRAETECARLMDDIRAEFAQIGREEDCTSPAMAERLISDLTRHMEETRGDLTAATVNYEKAKGITAALGARLDPSAEGALRALRKRTMGTAEDSTEELIRKRDFLSEALAGLDHKRAEAERAETALAATAKDPTPMEAERDAVLAELNEARARLAALDMALEALREAGESLREGILPHIAGEASAIFETLTEGAYHTLRIDDHFNVTLDAPGGTVPLSRFSAGCRDAAYLSLRLALLKVIAKEPMPLLLDEALSRLDDNRAKAFVKFLHAYCKNGAQCLLFSCHTREAGFLARHKNVTRISLA